MGSQLYHPGDLSANTDGKGKVNEFFYEDLQKLDVAYHFERDGAFPEREAGHKIPLLEEVLNKFPTTKIIINLKSLPADKLIEAVARAANNQNAWDRLVFYSTDDDHLTYLKTNYPQAKSFESRRNTVEELLNVNGSERLAKTDQPIWLGFELVRQMKITEKLALGDADYPVNSVISQASALAPYRYLELPLSILSGFLFFQEVPSKYIFIGAAIIIPMTCFISFYELNNKRKIKS